MFKKESYWTETHPWPGPGAGTSARINQQGLKYILYNIFPEGGDTKLTFDKTPRWPEGAQRRPFRKLKVAAKVLAGTVFAGIVGLCGVCDYNFQKEKKERAKIEAIWHTQDSLEEVAYRKDWEPIWGCGGGKASAGEIRSECIERKDSKLKRDSEMPSYSRYLWLVTERTRVISDLIDEYQWNVRWKRNPKNTCHITPAVRKEDSLYVLEGIREHDDATLAWETGWSIKANQGMGIGRRDSLISAILNKFRPMLPEVREREQDSVLVRSLTAAARCALRVIKANPDMDAGRRDSLISAILNKFRPMLPEVRGREQDSVLVRAAILAGETDIIDLRLRNMERNRGTRSSILGDMRAFKSVLKRAGIEIWGMKLTPRDTNLLENTGLLYQISIDSLLRAKLVRSALNRFEKVKLADGTSRKDDSLAVINTLESRLELGWESVSGGDHSQDPFYVKVTPGMRGDFHSHAGSAPPDLPHSDYRGNGIEFGAGAGKD